MQDINKTPTDPNLENDSAGSECDHEPENNSDEADEKDTTKDDKLMEEDVYENEAHGEIEAYLRFKICPLRFDHPEMKATKKAWKQNCTRRYCLREVVGTDVEVKLYHKRGDAEYAKRINQRSVPSMVRQKFFKFRRVLKKQESVEMVFKDHAIHHDSHNTAEPRLNERYMIVNLRKKVLAVCGNNCPVCAAHAPVKKKPIVPILTSRKGELVIFDLTKFYVPVIPFPPYHFMHQTTYSHIV
jgi:hypothetical protein